jgi:hypothetical protein
MIEKVLRSDVGCKCYDGMRELNLHAVTVVPG